MSGKRIVLCVALVALLAAPTPGAVGSCNGDGLEGFADLESYCTEREELICVRKYYRREFTKDESDDCRLEVRELCSRRFWPAECRPTRRVAEACLNALRSRDTLQTPVEEIDECEVDTLCTISRADAGEGP